MRMIQRRDSPRFLRKAFAEPRGRRLDRDRTAKARIARFPHFAHPAFTDAIENFVGPEPLAPAQAFFPRGAFQHGASRPSKPNSDSTSRRRSASGQASVRKAVRPPGSRSRAA